MHNDILVIELECKFSSYIGSDLGWNVAFVRSHVLSLWSAAARRASGDWAQTTLGRRFGAQSNPALTVAFAQGLAPASRRSG